jgi:hypothetical protein
MERQDKENQARNLLLIGAAGRNVGKTTLAAALVEKMREWNRPVNAAKIITVERKGAPCPHGGRGCGACSLDSDFVLCREYAHTGGKDTARLLAAGADRVFLLRSLKTALPSAFAALQKENGGLPLIAESNSLRAAVSPALFVMLVRDSPPPKPSALAVMDRADIVVGLPFPVDLPENILKRFLRVR